MKMANVRTPLDTIIRIREMWDTDTIGYIAKCCQVGTDTVKKYGRMSNIQAAVLIDGLKK